MRMGRRSFLKGASLTIASAVTPVSRALPAAATEAGYAGHAAAMHGAPKYGADFCHFAYVNPDAPKGGKVIFGPIGTYDSFNPFFAKGVPALGLDLMFETLMVQSFDEPFTVYGLIAERIEFPADRSSVTFTLRETARWHDGSPITAADVVFSFDVLTSDKSIYGKYFEDVARAEALDGHRVRFDFASRGSNRELPLITAQLPVLSKAYYEAHPFDRTGLDIPLGSGPYKIESFEAGRGISYRRDPNYWGHDLPVNRGHWNFDRIRYEYYRDETVVIEALKAGEYDLRLENSAKLWASAYDNPQLEAGFIVKEEIPHERPTGMQGFVLNTRRSLFRDRRVRAALAYAFDWEWTNRVLMHNAYTRTLSYFSNPELASSGRPGDDELALLKPHREQLPAEVFTQEYRPPETDGSGRLRAHLARAGALLDEAGWKIRDGSRRDPESGAPMDIEFMVQFGSDSVERMTAPILQNLSKLGIEGRLRVIDTPQYMNRLDQFDFDIVTAAFPQSLSPGNEQRDFWGSVSAATPRSRNLAGVRDPVVDALIEKVIRAPDREHLIIATRALDRVLLWGHYVIPQHHIRHFRVAYWNQLERPQTTPKYNLLVRQTWWERP